MEKFISQRLIELATEANNDDFSAKQVRLQRRNHRFTDVSCSKTVSTSSLLPENNRALSKFLYGILHSLISTIKLYQNQYIKKQFYINHASHLNKKNKF